LDAKKLGPQVVMDDPAAGGIESEEARELVNAVNEQLGSESLQFYPGSGHRNLMVWVDGKARAVSVDPERVVGRPIGEFLPNGDGADILRQVMEASLIILRDHPVNEERREAGKKPANCLWLWGQGRAPNIPKLTDRYQIAGAIVSASDLHRGVGICAGLDAVAPESLAGSSGLGGLGPAEAAIHELEKKDFVYLYVEIPAEIARGADAKAKVRVLEEFDRRVVGPLLEGLTRLGPHRLLLVCDYAESIGSDPHTVRPVPYVIYQGPTATPEAGSRRFTEVDAQASKLLIRDATKLLPKLLARG
jgi:2,3-bisphosphoglycerate-independent phosphoglycerate mutase